MPSTALALSTHAGGTAINRFCRALGEVGSLLVLAALVTSCSSSTSPAPLRSPTGSSAAGTNQITSTVGTASAPSVKPDTVEVIETFQSFWDAYNTQNWDAYTSLMCPHMRDTFTAGGIDSVQRQRAQNGLTMVRVNTVSIRGDSATVIYNGRNEAGPEPRGIAYLVRDGGGWKVCM